MASEPGVDFVLEISAQRAAKIAALRAHRTQHRSTDRWIFQKPHADQILTMETFRQAWGPPLPAAPLDDVFAELALE
jgi:hypothetical protein